MQPVKVLENVSARKHTDGRADLVLEWSKSNTMHQTMQQYITVRVCLSSTSTRQAVDAVGRIRVEKSRGLGQTADEVKHTWHNVQASKLSHCQRCGAEKKSKNQPQGCCSSCGRHARDKCFCCILSAGGKGGGGSLMCENEVSIRRGRSRYEEDEDRRQQQRRAGADNAWGG